VLRLQDADGDSARIFRGRVLDLQREAALPISVFPSILVNDGVLFQTFDSLECAHEDLGTDRKCAIDARTTSKAHREIVLITPVADLLSTRQCVIQDLLTIQQAVVFCGDVASFRYAAAAPPYKFEITGGMLGSVGYLLDS
jgi:hypothetical protein